MFLPSPLSETCLTVQSGQSNGLFCLFWVIISQAEIKMDPARKKCHFFIRNFSTIAAPVHSLISSKSLCFYLCSSSLSSSIQHPSDLKEKHIINNYHLTHYSSSILSRLVSAIDLSGYEKQNNCHIDKLFSQHTFRFFIS